MTQPLTTEMPLSRANRFLLACAGAQVDTTPIWIMRQAGRYLPDYQRTRAIAGDFLTLCKTPELACEVTLQPVERLGVDAAILFSDILIPLEAMGIPLAFTEEGPKVRAVRSAEEIAALRVPDAAECSFVFDAIRLVRKGLAGKVPLIGFAGAPFTMLTYAVEGQTGKQFVATKKLLYAAPVQAHALLDKITETVIAYLRAQVEAGAQALQLFDSWVGILDGEDFESFAAPYVDRVLKALRPLGVPIIYFANGGTAILPEVGKLPADVFALDWRLPIGEARRRLGIGALGDSDRRAVQGNLDPMVLFGPVTEIERRVRRILADAPPLGHIFNLGHGILPETPVPHVQALVEMVHEIGARKGSYSAPPANVINLVTTAAAPAATAGEPAATAGEAHATVGEAHATAGEAHATAGEAHATAGKTDASAEKSAAVEGGAHATAGEPAATAGELDATATEPAATANRQDSA